MSLGSSIRREWASAWLMYWQLESSRILGRDMPVSVAQSTCSRVFTSAKHASRGHSSQDPAAVTCLAAERWTIMDDRGQFEFFAVFHDYRHPTREWRPSPSLLASLFS
jgi:hypothetical protein